MNKKFKELSTWSHLTVDVLPPIRLKHPLRQSASYQQPAQQVDGTTGSSLSGHHGHKPMSRSHRLPPLDQYPSQAVQEADGINNNTSEVSFDLHYGFETECDDTVMEHERPKAPEPMILESLSNYDLSELLSKDEESRCVPVASTKASNNKDQTVLLKTSSNDHKKNLSKSNTDCLVLEDIDDSDCIDDQIFTTRNSDMFIVQAFSQEPLLDNFTDCKNDHLGSAEGATTVSQKSIKSTKATSRSHSSRLRRLANNITRVMNNKFRKLCRPTRAERSVTSKVNEKNYENQDGVVDKSTSTQCLLLTPAMAREFSSDT